MNSPVFPSLDNISSVSKNRLSTSMKREWFIDRETLTMKREWFYDYYLYIAHKYSGTPPL